MPITFTEHRCGALKAKISVIITTWNRSKLLGNAIKSVLAQSLPPLEILVCDDGSTDNTYEVVSSFADPRLVWIPSYHSGCPAIPRNRGIARSKGDWISFLDDDDEWLPEKLAVQIALLKSLDCLAGCTHATGINGLAGVELYNLGWYEPLLTFRDLLHGNRVICSSALIHRSVLNKVGGFPEAVTLSSMEDYAFWLRVATVTDFAFVSEPLVTYTDSPQTSLRSACADACQQKRIVFGNFLAWGCRNRITAGYMKAALYMYGQVLLLKVRKQLAEYCECILGRNAV